MVLMVAAFYKFAVLVDYAERQQPYLDFCRTRNLKGTILLAPEGINGTIAGSQADIEAALTFLRSDEPLSDLEAKVSYTATWPFERMKVRLKREIVAMGVPETDPCDRTGTYIEPQDWNALISDPTVTVIDTRNDYEVQIGTFRGAQNPKTASFRDFPDYVKQNLDPIQHSKIAMFCTGGIRCEKATAYLLEQGFETVYHLKGGILKYLETIPEDKSLWEGECFVFDERVAVSHGLNPGTHQLCRACGQPVADTNPPTEHHCPKQQDT
jgi:UPF0176 protein